MATPPADIPDLIERYFVAALDPDLEHYYALFANDAVVEDDGHLHTGIAEIRAWRTSVPDVTYTITEVEEVDGETVVTAVVTGAFPGSPVSLLFQFQDYDQHVIRKLRIHV